MDEYWSVSPSQLPTARLHGLLLSAVAPRPIAFASTIDRDGRPNLAPFSFFNVFSARPPILIFAPNRSGRTGLDKDTSLNVRETFEVVINVIDYRMAAWANVASAEFERGINEFERAGFTPLASEIVKPYRVAESPIQIECKVWQVVSVGAGGASGDLIICEAVKIHVKKSVLDPEGVPDPRKLDLVARWNRDWWTRATAGLFALPKPEGADVVGFENLPEVLKARLSP
ncbi:MAG: flavin reductase family protein, partial [Bacteroidia bacterium]|nr:flavin reductase family protein [Bacteroidia bacterium]